MKKTLSLLAFAASLIVPFESSAETVHVTKLRLSKVVLFDAPNGNPLGEMARDQYAPQSWQVIDAPQAGFVKISADNKTFWVKSMAIDTDRRVASTAECSVKVGGNTQKIGATRALGEECK